MKKFIYVFVICLLVSINYNIANAQNFINSSVENQSKQQAVKRFHDNPYNGKAYAELVSFSKPWSSPYQVSKLFPNYLCNADSNYLFILNRTAWAYFACSYPENVIRKAKEQGVTVIRVAMEGTPYKDDLKYDMWPWGGTRQQPDYSTINEPYWTEVEKRIRLAGENGIGINLTIYTTYKPKLEEAASQKYYWEMLISRLAKYSNILCWEIMNEYTANEDFQDVAGEYFYKHDPFKHPVISSDGTTDDALWPDKSWMGMSIVHTCTGSSENYNLAKWYNSIAKNVRAHGKPGFDNESGREIRHKNDDGINRRKQSWLFNSAGCFWTHHAWDGCEGINDTTYTSPGQEFLKPLSGFIQSIPFWTLQPNYTVCHFDSDTLIYNSMSDAHRNLSFTYLCAQKTGQQIQGVHSLLRLPNGAYNIQFMNPSTSRFFSETRIESKGLQQLINMPIPSFTDDLVIIIRKSKAGTKTLIPGTK